MMDMHGSHPFSSLGSLQSNQTVIRVTDILLVQYKAGVAGAHSSQNQRTMRTQSAVPRTGKRSVSRPPIRRSDDIKRVVESRWISTIGAGSYRMEIVAEGLCPTAKMNERN